MMVRFLSWAWRELRTHFGLYQIGGIFLISLAVALLIYNLEKVVIDLSLAGSWRVGAAGIFFALYLGYRVSRWWLRIFLVILLGCLVMLLDPGGTGIYVFRVFIAGFQAAIRGVLGDPAFPQAMIRLAGAWEALRAGVFLPLYEINRWLWNALQGNFTYISLASRIGWHALIWLLAVWMIWTFQGRQKAWLTMLPGGVVIFLVNAFRWNETVYPMAMYVAIIFLLSALNELHEHEIRWKIRKVGYSEETRADIALATAGIVVFLVAIASVLPKLPSGRIADLVLVQGEGPGEGERRIAEALGFIQDESGLPTLSGLALDNLPRLHLLGTGPELSNLSVMTVRPVNFQGGGLYQPYWRGLVYDIYTGYGWETSVFRDDQYQAFERAITPWQPAARQLRVEVIMDALAARRTNPGTPLLQTPGESAPRSILFSPGEIEQVDQRFWLSSRDAPGNARDIFGGQVEIAASKADLEQDLVRPYQVDAWTPLAGEALLRGENPAIPTWILNRYLQLPGNLPAAVKDLAVEITTQGTAHGQSIPAVHFEPGKPVTQFDRVHALESYLRTFPYTLNLSPPPVGQELVSYFLFDLQRGYCDYYATALAVMARSVGIPARLVVGYASGKFDPAAGVYRVSEAEAHTWVEVYFDGAGWIPFEPTAIYPASVHLEFQDIFRTELPPVLPTFDQEQSATLIQRFTPWLRGILWGILGLMCVYLIFVGVAEWRWRRDPPEKMLGKVIARVALWAEKQGVSLQRGRTPYEFFTGVASSLASKYPRAPALFSELADLYVQVKYSRLGFSRENRERTWQLWFQLRFILILAGFRNRLERWRRRLFVRRVEHNQEPEENPGG